MSKKPVNHILSSTYEPVLKNLTSISGTISKRWIAIASVHLCFAFLIIASVSSDYLFFKEIMISAGIVLGLLFFASGDVKVERKGEDES